MNNLNAYDILNRALKYKYNFDSDYVIASFEYILNYDQLVEMGKVLDSMGIPHEYKNNDNERCLEFWFVNVKIIINKNTSVK